LQGGGCASGANRVTAKNLIAYGIILVALGLVAGWFILSGRSRHRDRSRDNRIDLFRDE